MLAVILLSLFFFPLCFLYGWGTKSLLQHFFQLPIEETPPSTLLFLTGLMTISTIGSAMSLILPMRGLALSILFAGGLLIFLWRTRMGKEYPQPWLKKLKLPAFLWLLAFFLTFSVLLIATRQPSNPDTGIYHAQAIRWMETYPAVPGLGNLHHRFAYNSSWLVTNALFSLSFLDIQSFHLVPAMLFLIAMAEFYRGSVAWVRGNAHISNVLRTLLIPISFYTLASEVSSPGTDLPANLLLWLNVIFFLDTFTQGKQTTHITPILLFALSVYTVTIKLSTLPVLLFALFVLMRSLQIEGAAIKLILLAGVVALPWILRSIITSGYLIYPFPVIDWLNVDWKIPLARVEHDRDAILAWARDHNKDAQLVLALSTGEWMRTWFDNLTTNRQLIVVFCGLSPIFMGSQLLYARKSQQISTKLRSTLALAFVFVYIGAAYWLFTAPDYRFGYGFLMLLFTMPILVPLSSLSKIIFPRNNLAPALVVLLILSYQAIFSFHALNSADLRAQIIMPLPYPALPSEPCQIREKTMFCPSPVSYSQCWYEPFPCIPNSRPNVALRGSDLQKGFYFAP